MKSIVTNKFVYLQTKMGFKKLFLLNLIASLSLYSCKTIEVPEKWVFKETKYNYAKVTSEIKNSNNTEVRKDSILNVYNTIINTNEQKITTIKNVTIYRKFLKIDTLDLEYFVFEPQKVEKIGIFFIGNSSSIPSFRNELTTLANQTNSKIYVLNYRGYGKSKGTPSFKTQFEDNSHFLREIVKIEDQINYIIGYSLGSVFATRLATENAVNNLYLLSPFSNAKDIITHQKKLFTKGPKIIFRPFLQLKVEEYLLHISNTEQIKDFKGNLTIFHGTNDKILPYKMGFNLYENASTASKKIISIKGGNHNSPFKNENWNKLIYEIKS